jgi:hypothetical protein
MTNPLPVTIVRPKTSITDTLTTFLTQVISLALRGLWVMLLVPHFTPWHLSFWQSVAACLVVDSLVSNQSYLLWSKASQR